MSRTPRSWLARLASTTRARVSLFVIALVLLAAIVSQAPTEGTALWFFAGGARSLLFVGGCAALLATVLGGLLGMTAAHFGGLWDGVVTRFVELLTIFPSISLVALLRILWPQPSLAVWIASLAMVRLAESTRLARAEALQVETAEYVQAARALGASSARILFRHTAPRLVAGLAQSALFTLGAVVWIDAALAVLGLQTQSAQSSWGVWLARSVSAGSPTTALLPASALLVTLLAFAGIAEALRDSLDPSWIPPNPLRTRRAGSR